MPQPRQTNPHADCLRAALVQHLGPLTIPQPTLELLMQGLRDLDDDTALGHTITTVISALVSGAPSVDGLTAGQLRQDALHELIRRAGLRGSVSNATFITDTPFGPVAEHAGTLERVSAPGGDLTPLHSAGYYAQFDAEGLPHPTSPALLIRAALVSVHAAPLCGTETTERDLTFIVDVYGGRNAGTVPAEDRWTVLRSLSEDAPDLLTEAWEDATGRHLNAPDITAHFKGHLHD